MAGKFKMHLIEVSFVFLAFLSLAFFIKALDIKFHQFFVNNANIILVVSGILILFFLITGKITSSRLKSNTEHASIT